MGVSRGEGSLPTMPGSLPLSGHTGLFALALMPLLLSVLPSEQGKPGVPGTKGEKVSSRPGCPGLGWEQDLL